MSSRKVGTAVIVTIGWARLGGHRENRAEGRHPGARNGHHHHRRHVIGRLGLGALSSSMLGLHRCSSRRWGLIVIIDHWRLIIAEIGQCWGWSSSTACGMDGQQSSSSLELGVVVVVDGRWWAKKVEHADVITHFRNFAEVSSIFALQYPIRILASVHARPEPRSGAGHSLCVTV